MSSKELVLSMLKKYGKSVAEDLQEKAESMTGTELNGDKTFIPSFTSAVAKNNMLERKAGFVCKSSAGRVVSLIRPYDSNIYTAEPEELAAQWRFVWSDNPDHALPFVAISTSQYMKGNVCTENGIVYRSKIQDNVWSPSQYPDGWEVVE